MDQWKPYRRKGVIFLRRYVKGESLEDISVSDCDDPEKDMGWIARDPSNSQNQWYVTATYHASFYEEAS